MSPVAIEMPCRGGAAAPPRQTPSSRPGIYTTTADANHVSIHGPFWCQNETSSEWHASWSGQESASGQTRASERMPHVLLVEDNPAILHVRQAMMEYGGFTSAQAATANKALGLLANEPFDAILLDPGLPDS